MNRITGLIFILLNFSAWHISAQRNQYYTHPNAVYRDALDLFDKAQYAAAQKRFDDYLKLGIDTRDEQVSAAHFYVASCAMELFNQDAGDLMLDFVRSYPESPRVNRAYYLLGRFYFGNRKWTDAILYYQKVEERKLLNTEVAEFQFKYGYALFQEARYDEAYPRFEAAMDTDSEYAAPASYYYAHIAYEKKYYTVALDRFNKIAGDKRFVSVVPYYITQIYFLQQRYDELIAYAVPILDTVKVQKGAEVAKMTGEAYYKKQKYDESIKYLERFDRDGNPGREDRYQLGYAYYRSQQFPRSISMFTRVLNPKDSLAQIAHYHLGDAYINTGEKTYARTAFKEASALDFDKQVQEDALFNYAVLAYELSYNPFEEAIVAFEEYINNYPKSQRVNEAYKYLLKVYMTTKNYEAALTSIDRLTSIDEDVKRAYQMLAYNRGVELFHASRYAQAIDYLKKVKRYSMSLKLNASAKYYIAESYYKQDKYDAAIAAYQEFMLEPGAFSTVYYAMANYNLGYCWYKKKQNAKALEFFRKFADDAQGNDKLASYLVDCYLRLGDVYFLTLDNERAIANYDKAISMVSPSADYAIFQKAMALGYQQDFDRKIQVLQNLIDQYKSSGYQANARFEIAESYRVKNDNNKALQFYQQVIEMFPANLLVRKALLNSALIYYKQQNYVQAEKLYLRVLAEFPNPEDCRTAIEGLRDVYTAKDRIDEWEKVLASSKCGGFGEGSVDSTFFNSAKNLFFEDECDRAVESFARYLTRFPNGYFVTDAHYYRGECMFKLNKKDEALVSFENVLKLPVGKFTESSLVRAASINFDLKRWNEALSQYQRLEKSAANSANILVARTGIMRCAYQTKDYKLASDYAGMMLTEEKANEQTKIEAHFIIGIALKESRQFDEAIAKFRYVNSNTKSEFGAQARYHIAHIIYLQGKYEACEKEIFDFANQTPRYDDWVAKAWIVLADAYVMMGGSYIQQAKDALASLIEFYDATTEIGKEARKRLQQIEEEETNRNQRRNSEPDLEINGVGASDIEELNPNDERE